MAAIDRARGINPVSDHVGFRPGDKEGASVMQPIQTAEIDITAIHDIDGASFRQQQIKCMNVMKLAVCSVQARVRTLRSPSWQSTIRAKVLQGRKSINWANSVLPEFMGALHGSSPQNCRMAIKSTPPDFHRKSGLLAGAVLRRLAGVVAPMPPAAGRLA